jgi:peptide/nickel transport system substrate-binding protein
MRRIIQLCLVAGSIFAVFASATTTHAQKAGGTLKIYHRGTPPSGSIHEEATNSTLSPYMGVFNNLIMYDQHKRTNSAETIVPDLATEWSWNDDKTQLTFKLRDGVKCARIPASPGMGTSTRLRPRAITKSPST